MGVKYINLSTFDKNQKVCRSKVLFVPFISNLNCFRNNLYINASVMSAPPKNYPRTDQTTLN